jgi:DnaJ-domain-containing protein 1
MQIPRRLKAATLGDLLGAMHRARLSGTLELREVQGARAGIHHLIHLRLGLVASVESDLRPEARDDLRRAPPDATPRREIMLRLEELFTLPDAELTFRVARTHVETASALRPAEFLHGRPRARDRHRPDSVSHAARPRTDARRRALSVLGLRPDATREDVNRAFRSLASRVHPDRYPDACEETRRALSERFAQIASAYHALV